MNAAPKAQTSWLDRDDYKRTLAVLGTLGLTEVQLAVLPTFEELESSVSPELKRYMHDTVYRVTDTGERQPLRPELTVDFNFGTEPRFDALIQRAFPDSSIDPLVLRQYETASRKAARRFRFGLYIADMAEEAPEPAAAGGIVSWLQQHKLGFLAQDEITSNNTEDAELKRGLLGRGLTPPEQRRKIQAELRHSSIYYEPGVTIDAMTLPQYLILQAKRYDSDNMRSDMLDTAYMQTVFPNYEPVKRGDGRLGTERVPVAHWTGEGLHIATTGNHYGDERQGARRVASLILPATVTTR